ECDVDPCEAAVKLAIQRLDLYLEDARVAHQVLRPAAKKKAKAETAAAED
ncbi:unnamed protein product, partial [Durusdinium trenchii]